MAKIFIIFFLGGTAALLIYRTLSGHPFFLLPHSPIISRSFSLGNLLQVIAILIAAYGIIVSIDHVNEQRRIERLDRIRGNVEHLKAAMSELENNLTIYEEQLTPQMGLYKSGASSHFAQYRTLALPFNIEHNTLEFNVPLKNRLLRFYHFLDEANAVFKHVSSSALSQAQRSAYYTQIFSQHKHNEPEWRTLINDLGAYANGYEPIALSITEKALRHGTRVIAYTKSPNNKLVVMNIGGESAQDIKIKISFKNHPNARKKYILAHLAPRHPAEFPLDPPIDIQSIYYGKGRMTYESRHSRGKQSYVFELEWDPSKKIWNHVPQSKNDKEGWDSFSIGHISSGEYDNAPRGNVTANLEHYINRSGDKIIIKNVGNSVIEWLNIINEFGDIEKWHDVRLQYALEPGETVPVHLPKQAIGGKSIGGKIIFKSERQKDPSYMIFSYKWDSVGRKWIDNH